MPAGPNIQSSSFPPDSIRNLWIQTFISSGPLQLGELVGVTQQQIASFETGRRRMPISTLPLLAKALGTSIEELIGEPAKPDKRGPAPKLQQQLEQLSRLPKAQQKLVSQVIDSVLAQANRYLQRHQRQGPRSRALCDVGSD